MNEQNPHRCSDNGCVMLVPGVPKGVGTNGGCKCLASLDAPESRGRVRRGIRWLAERAAALEAALRWVPVADALPDEDTQVQLAMPDRGISLGHLSRTVISGVDVWSLPRVRRVDIDDATHWRPLGAGPEVGQ
jgi:hypothetical protein